MPEDMVTKLQTPEDEVVVVVEVLRMPAYLERFSTAFFCHHFSIRNV